MNLRISLWYAALLCALSSAFASPSALHAQPAQPKAGTSAEATACIESYEKVQTQRESGKLRAARESAISCARDACPKAIASECATWLGELAESQPSVVFAATGPKGEDLTAVKVYFGDELITEELTSRALAVDPGKYKAKFESTEHGVVETTVVVREGEKNRKLSVKFEPEAVSKGKPEKPAELERPVPVATWVIGGVGAAGIIAGVVFESLGLVKKSELDDCKPQCAADDVDEMMRDFVVGDVSLVAGGVVVGAALVVFLTRPSVPKESASATPTALVAPGPNGVSGTLRWRF